jgi:hypothetical protein
MMMNEKMLTADEMMEELANDPEYNEWVDRLAEEAMEMQAAEVEANFRTGGWF